MRSGTNLPRVGGYNQAVVLDAIRTRGPVSRIELGPLTGLTNQTVSNLVRRLLDAGLITESGHAPSSGGKRRTLLMPRADGAYALGVHLDPDAAVIVLADLVGSVLQSHRFALPRPSVPEEVVDEVARAALRLPGSADVDPGRLLGLGVAAPGPLDGERGTLLDPPNFDGWRRVPLLDMFAKATGMPVALDNDATAAAIGERWIGGKRRADDFLFLYMGAGLGAGIMVNNQVLRGGSGNAGEIGHAQIDAGSRPCDCGSNGCLGPHCNPAALVDDLFARHGSAAARRLGLSGGPEAVRADWRLLRRAVRAGDPSATDVVRLAGRRMGQAVRGAVALLDVSLVVLGGEAFGGVEHVLGEEIDAAVNTTSVTRALGRVTVEPSLIGETAGAVGAASLVLHGRYAPGWRMLTEASAPR
ncbi:ROK family transcriptional regulator [Streptomyces fuscigenes]|uniref:ROK family transcriptional regulator n=1 Tax=Streptomyces fuscigenes TaxID=1528880 RepID=UPI001F33549E|nr:ROK family transcriptional regulator [Streptomyces fuscigenes]MCF3962902.1 ROK family transcriptional regulator [Streptomyces fuscigenes]